MPESDENPLTGFDAVLARGLEAFAEGLRDAARARPRLPTRSRLVRVGVSSLRGARRIRRCEQRPAYIAGMELEPSLSSLSDDDLLRRLRDLVSVSRRVEAD